MLVGADIIRPSFVSLRFFGRIISAPTVYDGVSNKSEHEKWGVG